MHLKDWAYSDTFTPYPTTTLERFSEWRRRNWTRI
jgi:hypothetical protein